MAKEKETFRIFLGTYLEDKSPFDNFDNLKINIEKHCNTRIRWVDINNLHLTWKFLDQITASRIERVVEKLNSCVVEFKPMLINFDQLVIWPNNSNPRQIVWLGNDENNNTDGNFKILDNALNLVGFKKEKRSFKPHITIGRFKFQGRLKDPLEFPFEKAINQVKLSINKISVVKSTLLTTGPVYETVYDILIF